MGGEEEKTKYQARYMYCVLLHSVSAFLTKGEIARRNMHFILGISSFFFVQLEESERYEYGILYFVWATEKIYTIMMTLALGTCSSNNTTAAAAAAAAAAEQLLGWAFAKLSNQSVSPW